METDPGESTERNLTGNYFVRRYESSNDNAKRLSRNTKDLIELRSHALKLRYFPNHHATDDFGQVIDLDWTYIKALPGLKIGELRIHETIGGNDNLRVIFFVGPPSDIRPMTCIWILSVIQKKRDDFTTHQLQIFKGQRQIVLTRHYGGQV
jgi:hypothetical protein